MLAQERWGISALKIIIEGGRFDVRDGSNRTDCRQCHIVIYGLAADCDIIIDCNGLDLVLTA